MNIIINFDEYICEDGGAAGGGAAGGGAAGGGAAGGGAAGGGGVASANAGTVSGMGNVVSAQPSSMPGATVTGDGTTGSGDYGNVSFPSKYKNSVYTKNTGSTGNKYLKLDKKKGKKKKGKEVNKFISDVKNIMSDRKGGNKMKSFDDFKKDSIEKVTKVKQ